MSLLNKYNVPGPRYTSYPTVPYWDNTPSSEKWLENVKTSYQDSEEGLSLYIHLPYCETFCTYCACNKVITKNHSLEEPYINAVLKEWSMYLKALPERPVIKHIHLGGGTPTFFSPENIDRLISSILRLSTLADQPELSIEVHPNTVSQEHLNTLKKLGFNRISIGIQDFDPVVQKAINRIQTVEEVDRVLDMIRETGGFEINFDLIYGLPFQTISSIENTMKEVIRMNPGRIAYYSYAHVPWHNRASRLFTEADLPKDLEKLELYERGASILTKAGFDAIGMDHFALPNDELHLAEKKGELHRNFMGYTVSKTDLLIGLGVSSISESKDMYAQNEKSIKQYYDRLKTNELPITKGHILTSTDKILKKHIMNLMCNFSTKYDKNSDLEVRTITGVKTRLKEMENDGLVGVFDKGILLSPKGKPFVRNVCMALDERLLLSKPETRVFSQTV